MLFLKNTFFCALLLSCLLIQGQDVEQTDSSQAIPFIRFQYAHLFPSGDFEISYGNSNAVGGALGFKTKSNWQFELEYNYMFEANVRRGNFLSDIINEAGDATDSDGELVKLVYDLRGFSVYASVGRLFPIKSESQNSGLLAQFGVGFIQHRTFIDYRDGDVYQLNENMLKGFDRLHNGIALKQFIGYQHFGKKNLVNFYLGFEFQEGFTKNRREYNYDTRAFDTELKSDFLYGFRAGWSFPIRRRASGNFYYY